MVAEETETRTNQAWSLETYPNPFETPDLCQMTEPGYICDPDMVLEVDEGKFGKQFCTKNFD